MEPTLTPSRRLDALDAEEFGQMVDSESFRLLWGRVQQMLQRHQETCTRSDSELAIRRAQGAVATLDTVLKLPEMLLAEMKAEPRYVKSANRAGPSNR